MNSLYSTIVLLLLFFNAVLSDNQTENDTESSGGDRSDYKRSLFEDCNSGFSFTCMKLELVSWVDKMSQENEYNLIPGVALVREVNATPSNTAELISEMAKSFPSDPDSRLNMALFKKISGFLNSHSVKVKLLPDVEGVSGRASGGGGLGGGGGGGGKKGGGGMGMLLAGAAMMKGTLLALALGALAALAGKALLTGLIALLLSSIIGLKSLTSGGGKTTYEVVAKPIYTHEKTQSVSHEDYHDHGHGHYRRSFDDLPLPLGLQPGYKP